MRYTLAMTVAILLALSFSPSFSMAVSPAQAQNPSDTADYSNSSTPPAAPSAKPVGGTTIQTTAPVQSTNTISIGTWAGEALKYIAALFVASIGTVLTFWIKRMFDIAGIKMTQAQSEELDHSLVRGLNAAAEGTASALRGKGNVEVKDAIVAGAIDYVTTHKEELLKSMGADTGDASTIQALKARIATLAADPTKPTPPVLNLAAAAPSVSK